MKAKVNLGVAVRASNCVEPVKQADLALAVTIFRAEYKKALVRENAFQNGTELPGLPVSEADFDASHYAPEDAALGVTGRELDQLGFDEDLCDNICTRAFGLHRLMQDLSLDEPTDDIIRIAATLAMPNASSTFSKAAFLKELRKSEYRS